IMAAGSATTGKDFGLDNSSLTSSGYNLIQTAVGNIGDSLFTPGTGDMIAVGAPSLSQTTLTASGVTMVIFAELSGSNTIDKIPLSVCTGVGITVDQRGNTRGDSGDGKCDIGSYEFP
ncbi:MAG: choice-of-anchor Q domain-containing protein, partial [Vulcanimicrobiaceae bacterium]